MIANLLRKKTRTVLTLLSIVTAFLLFGLLQAVNVLFTAGADFVGATRLVTQARVSFTTSLPMRLLPQIEAVPGVERVMWQPVVRRRLAGEHAALHPGRRSGAPARRLSRMRDARRRSGRRSRTPAPA